ncbi:MAG: hypothetical protein ABI370_00180 [Gammaproteobacteria bacterium]
MKTRLEELLQPQLAEKKLQDDEISAKQKVLDRAKRGNEYNRLFNDLTLIDKEFRAVLINEVSPILASLRQDVLDYVKGFRDLDNGSMDLNINERLSEYISKTIAKKFHNKLIEVATEIIELACTTLLDNTGHLRPSTISQLGLDQNSTVKDALKSADTIRLIILAFVTNVMQDMGLEYLNNVGKTISNVQLHSNMETVFLALVTANQQQLLKDRIAQYQQVDPRRAIAKQFAKTLGDMKGPAQKKIPSVLELIVQADFDRCEENLFLKNERPNAYRAIRLSKLTFWRHVMVEYGVIHAANPEIYSALMAIYNKNFKRSTSLGKRDGDIALLETDTVHAMHQHLLCFAADKIYSIAAEAASQITLEDKETNEDLLIVKLQRIVEKHERCVLADTVLRSYRDPKHSKRSYTRPQAELGLIEEFKQAADGKEIFGHLSVEMILINSHVQLQIARGAVPTSSEGVLEEILKTAKQAFLLHLSTKNQPAKMRIAKLEKAHQSVLAVNGFDTKNNAKQEHARFFNNSGAAPIVSTDTQLSQRGMLLNNNSKD